KLRFVLRTAPQDLLELEDPRLLLVDAQRHGRRIRRPGREDPQSCGGGRQQQADQHDAPLPQDDAPVVPEMRFRGHGTRDQANLATEASPAAVAGRPGTADGRNRQLISLALGWHAHKPLDKPNTPLKKSTSPYQNALPADLPTMTTSFF